MNATRLLDAHAAALANQSFTVETSATALWAGWNRSVRVGTNDTAVVEMTRRNATAIVVDGRRYERSEGPRGVEYMVTNWSDGGVSARDAYATPDALRNALDPDGSAPGSLTLNGTVERDGRTLWRLTVQPRGDPAPNASSGTVLVTPAGRIVTVERTLTVGQTPAAVSVAFSAVGDTAVAIPDWVADARRHGEYRGFGHDQRRLTTPVPRAFTGEFRGAVTLVGVPERADYGDIRTGPVGAPDDPLADAVVGWYAYVEASTDHDYAYVTLQYNESRLSANASESSVALYRLVRGGQSFERLDGSVDADENEVSARVEDAAGMYVVFHAPTYERLVDELEAENGEFRRAPRTRSSASRP